MNNEMTYAKSQASFISKTFLYMALGLFVTFGIGYFVSQSDFVFDMIYSNPAIIFVACGVELVLVWVLGRNINKMSVQTALTMFIVYALVNGLTFGSIFLAYDLTAVVTVFFVSAVTFLACGFVGVTIQRDLSTFARFAMMALIGVIVASIANMFLGLQGLEMLITYVGLFIFCGLTAYDMQTLKRIHYESYSMDSQTVGKYAVIGALNLYLDFINIFLYLLRLLARRD